MATLTVSHYIYLTRDQRYRLHSGEALEVVGISVPVWFDKGTTSEPAREIFCKYKLTNNPANKAITPYKEGYNINLPQKTDSASPQKIMTSSKKMLDINDGGSESLEFRQYNVIHTEENKFNVVHFVEIKPEELLKNTLS
jgi:hypothetical protein